jgi:hypothetical protein
MKQDIKSTSRRSRMTSKFFSTGKSKMPKYLKLKRRKERLRMEEKRKTWTF